VVHKLFPTVFSSDIKWHQTLTSLIILAVWNNILSDLWYDSRIRRDMVWCTANNDRSTKWIKITLNLIVPMQSLTIFYWRIPIVSQLFGPIGTLKIHEDQRHQKSRKGRKRPENGVTSTTEIYWSFFKTLLLLLFTLDECYPSSSKNVHSSRKSNW